MFFDEFHPVLRGGLMNRRRSMLFRDGNNLPGFFVQVNLPSFRIIQRLDDFLLRK